MNALLSRQRTELKSLSASFVKLEEEYYEMASVNYEELSTSRRGEFDRRLKELEQQRVEVMRSIETASRRVETTRVIISAAEGQGAPVTDGTEERAPRYRIPTLPSFRGKENGAIDDPFEFLGKIKAMLTAHEVPQSRWHPALLTCLNGYDRQWAESNLDGLDWSKAHDRFLHHFESPAIRDRLVRDLMTISQKSNESVQEYSDRFTSLMARTGRRDDDETLVAVYIEGLDTTVQDLMHVARAATLSMWKRTNTGSPPISIADEIANAITLDSSKSSKRRENRHSASARQDSSKQTAAKKKRCGHCNSRNHSTEDHRGKPTEAGEQEAKHTEAASRAQLRRESKCFKCKKPWKPGHKCSVETKKEPQAASLRVQESCEESDAVSLTADLADAELQELFGYADHDSEAQLRESVTLADQAGPDPIVNQWYQRVGDG
ncbi:Retrotransposon gag protein [Gracilaria domingensis]|nr:Retrotransposon gag protein [Gracilaria domingensis]